jgi:hypothetical protein
MNNIIGVSVSMRNKDLWKQLYTLDDSVEFLSDLNISVFADTEPFREFLARPLQRGPSSRDITTSQFAGTAITDHSDQRLR